MEQFTTVLATSFGIDPARITAGTTDLVIDKVESLTGSMDTPAAACSCFCGVSPTDPLDVMARVTATMCGHSDVDAD